MGNTLEEFRKQANQALRAFGAKVEGLCFTFNEETFCSSERGLDIQQLAEVLGTSSKKILDGRLVLALEGGGGRLTAAFGFKEAGHDPEKVSGLLNFLLRNLLLREERDRDGLTGFLKKEAFRERMFELALEVKKEVETPSASERGKKTRSPVLSFFHIDLDHFKEINDTLGHRFGDEVLRSFARQIRDFFATRSLSDALLSRLGGEEFGILIPYLPATDAQKLGEEMCEYIRSTSIPAREEIENYRRNNPDFKAISFPRVTASVGIATADSAIILRAPQDSLAGELDQIYERADVATYVAKKLGRDRVMAFNRILAEGGMVLDYDERTGIVTIDLGSDMGVDAGDVFRVYDNRKFTGREPVIQPGSQQKVIGYFPRLVLGELEVIMSQPQVSFALRRGSEVFIPAPGFLLEWVAPSERGRRVIGDRRGRDRRRSSVLSTRSLFETRLREMQEHEKLVLALITFDNLATIREQRGSSTLKELYRSLASELGRLSVPGDVVISLSAEVIAFLPSVPELKATETKLSELKRNFAARERATFSAVIFPGSAKGLDRSRALDIAKKGLEIVRFKGVDQILVLDSQALLSKLFFYYEHGEYDKVALEYSEIRSLGLTDERAILCYAEALSYLGNREEAVEAAREILKKDQANPAALEVLASTAFELNRYTEAADSYERLVDVKKGEIAPWQWRDYAIALLYLGEIDKALQTLERALKGDPTDASAIYHKGEVLLAMGKKEAARAEFMSAFEQGYRELSPQAAKLLGEG